VALDIKLSRLETWTGPLACDPAMRDVLASDAAAAAAARLRDPNGGPWVGPLPDGATRVQVRGLSRHDLLIVSAVAEQHAAGPQRSIAQHVEAARRGLLWLSDLPDTRPGPDGYPVELLAGSDLYAAIVLEVAQRALALGALGKAAPSSSGTPSGEPQPAAGASATPATAATAAAVQGGG